MTKENIVLSTRMRLARNIEGFEFPPKLSEKDGQKVIDKVKECIQPANNYFTVLDNDTLKKNSGKLLEEHLVSYDFLNKSFPISLILSTDKKLSIMINEEDHIRIQSVLDGYNPDEAFKLCNMADDLISEKTSYAFSEKYGYLTSCPTNVGTGLRASFMIHLPAITLSNRLEDLKRNVARLGITVRGYYGEGSKSFGNLYQISNNISLGLKESEIIDNLKRVVEQIAAEEEAQRNKISDDNIKDNIYRSYGLLKNSYMMKFSEFAKLWSYVIMGMDMEIIDKTKYDELKKMIFLLAPYSIQAENKIDEAKKRAHYLRKNL